MKIEPTMNLDHLADLMYLTGSEPVDAEVVAMRDLLLQGQESHKWQTTSDVEDAEWFAMLDEAVSGAAKKLRGDDALAAAAPDLLAESRRLLARLQEMAIHPSHYAGLAAAIARATGDQ